jgi:hypothetical protein
VTCATCDKWDANAGIAPVPPTATPHSLRLTPAEVHPEEAQVRCTEGDVEATAGTQLRLRLLVLNAEGQVLSPSTRRQALLPTVLCKCPTVAF